MGISVQINIKSVFKSAATSLCLLGLMACAGGGGGSSPPPSSLDQGSFDQKGGGGGDTPRGGINAALPTQEVGSHGPGQAAFPEDRMFIQISLYGKELNITDTTVKILVYGNAVFRSDLGTPYREELYEDGTALRVTDAQTKTYLDTNLFTREGQKGVFEFTVEIPVERFEEYSALKYKGLFKYYVRRFKSYDPQQVGIWRNCQSYPSKYTTPSDPEANNSVSPSSYSQLQVTNNLWRAEEHISVAQPNTTVFTTPRDSLSENLFQAKSVINVPEGDTDGNFVDTIDRLSNAHPRYQWSPPDLSWMDGDREDCPGI